MGTRTRNNLRLDERVSGVVSLAIEQDETQCGESDYVFRLSRYDVHSSPLSYG